MEHNMFSLPDTSVIKTVLPAFKIEQIAIASDKPQYLIAMLGSVMGLKDWSIDIVTSKASVFGGPETTNVAELNFNYDLGFELEVLHYKQGDNWHQARLMEDCGYPFLSHLGFHCSEEDAQATKDKLATAGINMAQEVWTLEHTNPVIAGKRTYHYMVFDSRDVFGFDLKLIVRNDVEAQNN
jgi:hypothetical protein